MFKAVVGKCFEIPILCSAAADKSLILHKTINKKGNRSLIRVKSWCPRVSTLVFNSGVIHYQSVAEKIKAAL